MKRKSLSRAMVLGLTMDALKLLSRRHALDILRALATNSGGLRFNQIAYDIVKNSSTANSLLSAFRQVGWVTRDSDMYVVTDQGKRMLSLSEPIVSKPDMSVPQPSTK